MAVAKAVSISHIEQELAMVESWAARHSWSILWDPDRLLLVVLMRSAIDGERYIFEFNSTTTASYRPPSSSSIPGQEDAAPGGHIRAVAVAISMAIR